jgi:YHS domain-containing protein
MIRAWHFLAVIGLTGLLPAVVAAQPAVGGKCPVCLFEMGKPVPGSKEIKAIFDRQTYLFADKKAQAMFTSQPEKYTPVLAGDCVVCLVEMGVRMPGKAEFATKYQDRLFLFPSPKQLEMFKANPKKYASADAPLGECCPVCWIAAKKCVPGKKELTSIYDGMRYHFPDGDLKKKFDAYPARFVPVLDGNCTVCLKDGGKQVRGKPEFALVHESRTFLFADEVTLSKFKSNPSAYTNVDLANKGNCVVCQKMAGKAMAGSAEHVSIYKGKRYLFPSEKERTKFDADPVIFTSTLKTSASIGGSANKNLVSVVGRTACAGCEFGVGPLSDPKSLGLAVVSADKVYIVENAERLYPKLFADRADGGSVQLQGTPTKAQGRFVWIESISLQTTR